MISWIEKKGKNREELASTRVSRCRTNEALKIMVVTVVKAERIHVRIRMGYIALWGARRDAQKKDVEAASSS